MQTPLNDYGSDTIFLFKFVWRQIGVCVFGCVDFGWRTFLFLGCETLRNGRYQDMEEIYEMNYTGIQKNHLPIGDMRSTHLTYVDRRYEKAREAHAFILNSKKYYDECLRLMDQYALKYKGEICGMFDRHAALSDIRVRVRHVTFVDTEDMHLLSYISEHASKLLITEDAGYNGISVTVNCFHRNGGDKK